MGLRLFEHQSIEDIRAGSVPWLETFCDPVETEADGGLNFRVREPAIQGLHPFNTAEVRLWENARAEFVPFLQFDAEIRRIVRTTNAIESVNARIRRAVRARGHFPSENAALKCVYLAVMPLDPTGTGHKRWTTRWKRALQALDIAFNGRLTQQPNLTSATEPVTPFTGQTLRVWNSVQIVGEAFDDLVCGLGPDVWLGVGVPGGDPVLDSLRGPGRSCGCLAVSAGW